MTETRTFLQGATLAIAVAIPLAAIGAVLFSDDDERDERERMPCPGCGEHGCALDSGLELQEDDGDL